MQKKILIFIPEFPVLSETFIEREVDGLVRSRKVDVVVVALSGEVEFRSKRAKGVTVYKRLNLIDALLGLTFFLTSTQNVISAWKYVGIQNTYLFFKSLGYTRIFSKYKPDVIYSHFLSEPSTISLIASIILDLPFAISAHARDVLEYPHLAKEKVRRAKFITFCNRNALEAAKNLAKGENIENLRLVYHGIDPDTLRPRKITVKKPAPNFIFSIGRLTEKKGMRYLIEASKILKSQGFKHVIYIAAGGELFDELNKLIDSKGLENEVVLLGKTPFKEVIQYFQLADVYVQPSINAAGGDADGVPTTLIEAGMLKIPIVTTDAGSIRDFLNEDRALMVSQRNSSELADAIIRLFNDKELQRRLTENAYNKALEMFDIEKSMKKIEKMLIM